MAIPRVNRRNAVGAILATMACLAAYCVAFISVSYFDQINVFWFLPLAVIATVPMWAAQKSGENLIPQEVDDVHVDPVAGETILDENCLVEYHYWLKDN